MLTSQNNFFVRMAQYKGAAKEGQRAMSLQKKRERHQEEIEVRKKKLADELKVGKMEAKFSAHYDAVEVELKSSTCRSSHLIRSLTFSWLKSCTKIY